VENRLKQLMARVAHLKWRILNSMHYAKGTSINASDQWREVLASLGLDAEEINATKLGNSKQCIALANEECLTRLSAGDSLLRLVTRDGETVSWGWRTSRDHFYISEVGLWLHPRGDFVFYDYHTPSEHRGKGYHTIALHFSFSTLKPGQTGLIFALSNNMPPLRAYAKMMLSPIHPMRLLLTRGLTMGRRDRFPSI
jgi:hypothetical protein